MYAETDFVLALIKENDRLKNRAGYIYEKHRRELWSSQIMLQEILLYCYKNKIKADAAIERIIQVVEVRNVAFGQEEIIATAHVMERYAASPFGAMHSVVARLDGTIVSSDGIYDKIGINRLKLEEPMPQE